MPRLTPITQKSALPENQQYVADKVVEVFGHIRGPFSMLLHSPQVAEKLLPLVRVCRSDNTVDPRLRFAAILAAVREGEAAYVWAAQVEQARKNGMREELIDIMRARGESSKLPPDEREVVDYVRQLVRDKRVDDAKVAALKDKYGAQWLVELTAIVAFFGFVSTICNAFDVEPPAGLDKLKA